MSIWFGTPTLDGVRRMSAGTMVEALGIEFTAIGPDSVSARMSVDHRHVQPMRLLHGGASVVLAETLGSVAANLTLDTSREFGVGLDVNANHLRGVREGGAVVATARPLHVGRTTQVWEIRIDDEESGKLACISRLTMAIRQMG